jgi:hypothetical protein
MSVTGFNARRRALAKQAEKKAKGKARDGIEELTVPELKEIAKEKNIPNYGKMKKDELIKALKG